MGRGAGGLDSHQLSHVALILNNIQHHSIYPSFSEKAFDIYLVNYLSHLSRSALRRRLKSNWHGSVDRD